MTGQARPSIVEAISAVMAEVTTVGKFQRHEQAGYAFRGLDAVVNAVGPALRRHGVVVVPLVEEYVFGTIEVGQADKRRTIGHCRLTVAYRWHGPAGDFIDARVAGEAFDSGDKATSKALAVAWRTVLVQVLAIPTADEPQPASGPHSADQEPSWPATPARPRSSASEAPATRPAAAQPAAAQPAPGPDSASRAQLTAIATLLGRCAVHERPARLAVCAVLAGRELASSAELSKAEAGQVIEALQRAAGSEEPGVVLAEILEGMSEHAA